MSRYFPCDLRGQLRAVNNAGCVLCTLDGWGGDVVLSTSVSRTPGLLKG